MQGIWLADSSLRCLVREEACFARPKPLIPYCSGYLTDDKIGRAELAGIGASVGETRWTN